MSPEVAMEQYINLLSDRVPGWTEDKFAGGIKADSSEAVVSSTVAESSEAEISSNVASDASTFSQHQPNYTAYIDERKPEQKSGAEEADQTGGSNLEDKVKERKNCSVY
ncbi:acyl-CoA-binding domain-containing protein 5-like [Quercus suber]|uniref:acyl-CoA-binding domain-containing protein 5-like n=1 Tax=Quercus suber TaxID=58331 RepID=UPI0032DF3499